MVHVAYSQDTVFKDVGCTRQLFVDDDVIAAVKNVTRRQHRPAKHPANPVIVRDRPWEFSTYFRTSTFNVLHDPRAGLFKCWYEDFYSYFGSPKHKPGLDSRIMYAQSEDGLHWEKPTSRDAFHRRAGYQRGRRLQPGCHGQLRDGAAGCSGIRSSAALQNDLQPQGANGHGISRRRAVHELFRGWDRLDAR